MYLFYSTVLRTTSITLKSITVVSSWPDNSGEAKLTVAHSQKRPTVFRNDVMPPAQISAPRTGNNASAEQSAIDDLPQAILNLLAESGDNAAIDSLELAQKWKLDHQKIVGAIKSLMSLEVSAGYFDVISNKWVGRGFLETVYTGYKLICVQKF